ncbi:MAG TPA: hypothetical protein VE130_08950 [Nitrososphaeraceae archaeon]|jgi:hypothetical protein|nr:hypothetical protein [Nitrososphaeraceae archaeon]
MVKCDSCNRPEALGGILVPVEKYIEEIASVTSQRWCLDCIRGTKEERERRELNV